MVVSDPNKDQDPQIVLSLEFDVDEAFRQQNFNNLLTMMEGMGARVRNNLYQPFSEQFVGERFILASNKIPGCSKPSHEHHESQWKPMLERTVWSEVCTKFDSSKPCPYDAPTLAGAIHQLKEAALRHPDLEGNHLLA